MNLDIRKIKYALTHILSACNTGCSKTETPNPFHSLWPASSGDHWGNKMYILDHDPSFLIMAVSYY